jgi:hypothetical protein
MKLIILQACTVAGESVSTHADIGDEVDVPKDDAVLLCRMGRALFLDKAEDPSKGQMTATKEDVATARAQAKALVEAREQAAQAAAPDSLAKIIAEAVAKGVATAQAANAKAADKAAEKAPA